MSAGQANYLALVGDTHENTGDDSGVDARLADLLHASIVIAKLDRRVRELERSQREDRAAINRILTRFATLGQPIPNGDAA